jgi:hypothetical protein
MDVSGYNPLIMTTGEFFTWLVSRGIAFHGTPPADPVQRASILFHAKEAGFIRIDEVRSYLEEIGLMEPVEET